MSNPNVNPSEGRSFDFNEPEPTPEAGPTEIVTAANEKGTDITTPATPPMTAAQARVDAVGAALMKAYERASMLEFNPEESKALMADFPDDAFRTGAAGKENLIYLEHAHIRERLNAVIGLGRWSIITRRTWSEQFRTPKNTEGVRIYVEAVLLIRGCFAAEAIGDMDYYPNNASQNYGDAVEGAKSAALRRCAKELGVGLQAWKKEFAEAWFQRKLNAEEEAREARRVIDRATPVPPFVTGMTVQPTVQTPPPSVPEPRRAVLTPEAAAALLPPAQRPVEAAMMTFEDHQMLLVEAKAKFIWMCQPILGASTEYAVKAKLILPSESLADIDIGNLFPSAVRQPATKAEVQAALLADYNEHMNAIKTIVDAENQIPGAEAPTPMVMPNVPVGAKPAPKEEAQLFVRTVNIRGGTTKNGKNAKGNYVRYAVVDDSETWYSTFDKKVGEAALAMKGRKANITFKIDSWGAGQSGNTMTKVTPA